MTLGLQGNSSEWDFRPLVHLNEGWVVYSVRQNPGSEIILKKKS